MSQAFQAPQDKTRYYPPDMLPLIYCFACIQVVLMDNDQAEEAFRRIIESYRFPDVKMGFETLEMNLPKGKDLIDDVMHKNQDNSMNPLKSINQGANQLLDEQKEVFSPWIDFQNDKVISKDYEYWLNSIIDFIRIGFNRPEDRVRGRCQIDENSSSDLLMAVFMRSYAEYSRFSWTELDGKPAIRIGGRTKPLQRSLYAPTRNEKKALKKQFDTWGYVRHQDSTIVQRAIWWYASRVAFPGPKAFANFLVKKGLPVPDDSNISNEIKPVDEALGYRRRGQE